MIVSKKAVAKDEIVAFALEDHLAINHNTGKSLNLNALQYSAFIYCIKKKLIFYKENISN